MKLFPSKRSSWVVGLMMIACLAVMGVAVQQLRAQESPLVCDVVACRVDFDCQRVSCNFCIVGTHHCTL